MSHPDEGNGTQSLGELIAAAEDASREMLAAIAGKAETITINQDYGSFRSIAVMLGRIAAIARKLEQDRMDAPVDGVRFWVAKPQLDAALDRARKAEAEVHRLSRAVAPEASLVFCDAAGNHISLDRLMAH